MLVMQVLVEVEGPPEVLGLLLGLLLGFLLGLPLLLLPLGLPLLLVVSYPLQYLSMCMVVSYNTLTCQ